MSVRDPNDESLSEHKDRLSRKLQEDMWAKQADAQAKIEAFREASAPRRVPMSSNAVISSSSVNDILKSWNNDEMKANILRIENGYIVEVGSKTYYAEDKVAVGNLITVLMTQQEVSK